jgi:hypothetical protein
MVRWSVVRVPLKTFCLSHAPRTFNVRGALNVRVERAAHVQRAIPVRACARVSGSCICAHIGPFARATRTSLTFNDLQYISPGPPPGPPGPK